MSNNVALKLDSNTNIDSIKIFAKENSIEIDITEQTGAGGDAATWVELTGLALSGMSVLISLIALLRDKKQVQKIVMNNTTINSPSKKDIEKIISNIE